MFSFTAERSNWEDEDTKLVWLPQKRAYEFASKYCKDKTVLDAGCGLGWGSFLLSKVAKKIIAVDIDDNSLNFAKKKFRCENLKFQKEDLEQLFSSEKFDIIVCLQTIEHLKNPSKFLINIINLLKKNGKVIISTPNRLSDHIPSPYHIREYSHQELKELLNRYFKKVIIFGLYEGKKIKKFMDTRRRCNKLLLKLDLFHLTNILPPIFLSTIFFIGSKLVGIFVKKSNMRSFKTLDTYDFDINRRVYSSAIDIISVCQ